MKLHPSVVSKLVKVNELYGGRRDNHALISELSKMDLSVYKKQNNEKILVLTEELKKQISKK